MDAPTLGGWSELPPDLLESIFKRLSFTDFHRAKIVCSNWNSSSKQTVPRKTGSPWLMLFPDRDNGCVLYNPDEDKVYETMNRDFSGIRFLANSGNWFLVEDSRSNLLIIDVFSENKMDLPPLERVGGKKVSRGLLWVDEKTKEFVVVLLLDYSCKYLSFCKKGDGHYTDIALRGNGLPMEFQGASDVVLKGYLLYIVSTRTCIRFFDLSSGLRGFKDLTGDNPLTMFSPWDYKTNHTIVVTTSGKIFLVENNLYKTKFESDKSFRIYKKDPNADPDRYDNPLLEVESLGDEALLLDLGFTVPANNTFGIEPNSIYFAKRLNVDVCVLNLATRTLKRFDRLSKMNLKDARWFLPEI